jgi:hypothetical protein
MRLSGVVSIALAKIGFVLVCTIFSEMLPPPRDQLIEVFKNNLAHFAP